SPHRARLGSRLLPCGHTLTTRQTSLDAADWWVAPSLKKARPHASTPGSLRTPVGCYEGVLAPPPAGLSPASRSGHQDARRVGDWRGGRLGPALSTHFIAGAAVPRPRLRFQPPLIKPGMRFSRTRLSEV